MKGLYQFNKIQKIVVKSYQCLRDEARFCEQAECINRYMSIASGFSTKSREC